MSFQYPYRINNIRKGGATSIDKKYRTFQYPYGINILESDTYGNPRTITGFQYPYETNILERTKEERARMFQYPYGINILERVPPANTCSYGVNFQGSANLPFWGV